jgi:hypothetical protein
MCDWSVSYPFLSRFLVNRSFLEEPNLRLLRKAFFPGVTEPFLTQKTALSKLCGGSV